MIVTNDSSLSNPKFAVQIQAVKNRAALMISSIDGLHFRHRITPEEKATCTHTNLLMLTPFCFITFSIMKCIQVGNIHAEIIGIFKRGTTVQRQVRLRSTEHFIKDVSKIIRNPLLIF